MEPQTQNTQPSNTGKKVGIGVAVVALLAIVAVVFGTNKSSNTVATDTTDSTTSPQATTSDTGSVATSTTPTATGGQVTTSTSTTPSPSSGSTTSEYKDGTYTATGSYMSPGGLDRLGVTLTLKNDIVTSASVKTEPGDHTSSYYQGIFASNYTPLVVGKNINDIKLSKVSGSSLTSGGFNEAVTQIEAQAKA